MFDVFSALKIHCKKLNALETSAYIPLEISDGFSALKIHCEYLHFAFLTFKINDSSYILLNKVVSRHFSTTDATRRARRPPAGPLDWKSLPESDLAARRTEFEFIRVEILGLGVIRITGRPTRPAAPHPGPAAFRWDTTHGPRTQDSRARPASVPVAATVTASGPAAFCQDRPPTRRSERPKAAKPTASRPALTAVVDPAGPNPGMDAQGSIG